MGEEVKLTWTDFGRYFGFPECCIEDFLSRDSAPKESRKLRGTGYTPCLKCNEKSEEELIDIINSNRQARTEFPVEEDHESILEHMAEIITLDKLYARLKSAVTGQVINGTLTGVLLESELDEIYKQVKEEE